MKRIRSSGRSATSRCASDGPFISGITTSVSRRSIEALWRWKISIAPCGGFQHLITAAAGQHRRSTRTASSSSTRRIVSEPPGSPGIAETGAGTSSCTLRAATAGKCIVKVVPRARGARSRQSLALLCRTIQQNGARPSPYALPIASGGAGSNRCDTSGWLPPFVDDAQRTAVLGARQIGNSPLRKPRFTSSRMNPPVIRASREFSTRFRITCSTASRIDPDERELRHRRIAERIVFANEAREHRFTGRRRSD